MGGDQGLAGRDDHRAEDPRQPPEPCQVSGAASQLTDIRKYILGMILEAVAF